MTIPITVIVDSRIRLPPGLPTSLVDELRAAFCYSNPDFHKKQRLGIYTGNVPRVVETWSAGLDGGLTLPRGGTKKVRRILAEHGYAPLIRDFRVRAGDARWDVKQSPEWPPNDIELHWYQEEAKQLCISTEQGLVRAPTGCLSGESIVGINRGGKSFQIELKHLVHRFNGGKPPSGPSWDLSIPTTVRARGEDGYVRLLRLHAAYESGKKEIYEVCTERGNRLHATTDHRFLTEDGWAPLQSIPVGTRVYVEGVPFESGTVRKKIWYKLVSGLWGHPHAGRRGVKTGRGGWSVPKHRLVMEARLNDLELEEYIRKLRTRDVTGLRFLDPKVWAVHHLDENPHNNESSNLAALLHEEHSRNHGHDQNWKRVATPTVLARVVSIRRVGMEMTYDLSVDAPNNFLANGMVVHNSGKTIIGLSVAAALRQPTLVVMRDTHLLEQWMDEAVRKFHLHPNEIGVITGSKRKLRIGARLTLALQQSLSSPSFPAEEVSRMIGCFMVDEVQQVAARTFLVPVDQTPARYKFGLSADETRRDNREYLIYDQFGEVLYEISRDVLEEEGFVVPVIVRLVPTDFRADWYRDADASEKDFGQLLEEMVADEAREHLLVQLVRTLVEGKQSPLFVFSQRKGHASKLADTKLFNAGVRCGLMIGGEDNAVRFKEDKAQLLDGSLPVAAGTFHALGVGLNIPRVRAGVMALPMGSNKQFFNQVRGRVCRSAPGKEDAFLYILWDRHVFPHLPKVVRRWNRGRTQVLSESGLWSDV